jgi:hypothetical protein
VQFSRVFKYILLETSRNQFLVNFCRVYLSIRLLYRDARVRMPEQYELRGKTYLGSP